MHFKKDRRRLSAQAGFTLIELLVVIAIIGLLSSIVLASLNSARYKGADAAIKGDLRDLESQAALFYDSTSNTYTGLCADSKITAILAHAQSTSGATSIDSTLATAGLATTVECHATATNFAIDVPLKTNSANSWCVDDSGNAKQETGYLGASVVACP